MKRDRTYWIRWAQKAGIRAAKTLSQTAIAGIGVSNALGEIDWMYIVSTASLAGIISLLTSIRGLPELNAEDSATASTLE
ncbi:MAG: holin [Eubacteriales bacterium]